MVLYWNHTQYNIEDGIIYYLIELGVITGGSVIRW